MAEPKFPKFSNFPCNEELEKLLFSTGNAGHRKDGNNDKHKYFRSLCQYSCTIPSWDQNGKHFSEQYEQSLLDMPLMKASENGEFLKWSRLTTPVYAVAVADDGHSLFHAVSMAMWGLQDKLQTMQQLVENALPDIAGRLHARWQMNASDVKAEDRQTAWSNIMAKLEGRSSSFTSLRKDQETDSLAIFILANVIHRPIIVINVPSCDSSYSTERVDTEGIFLPLEKSSRDCSKSPIVLCHSNHSFCPLMFMSSGNREAAFPLHKGDLSILPVRYGPDDTHTKALISQYLKIQEKHVISETGSMVTLMCSSVSITPLPEHFNSINIHLRKCQEIFQEFVGSRKPNEAEKQKVSVPPVGQHFESNPFQYIDESSQTYVVPLTGSRRKEGSSLPSPPLSFSVPPPISLYTSPTFLSQNKWEVVGLPTNNHMSGSQNNITDVERGGGEDKDKKSRCLTPGCVNKRDPGIGELCYSCFTRSTIDESGLELISLYEDGKQRYMLRQARLPGTDVVSHVGNKLPSQENICQAYSEMLSASLLSVMNESCRGCSHYYCSQKTYPYCHECSKNASENSREKNSTQNIASNVQRRNSVQKQSFPDAKLLPSMQVNHPSKSFGTEGHIKNKEDEKFDSQIFQNFCQSEGCDNLRQENSNLCLQCRSQRQLHRTTSPNVQIVAPRFHISSSETKEQFALGQAECLSHNSDKDVIEISESPSLKNDIRKCASPVCETIIFSPQMLCEKCQAILVSHSQHHNRDEHLKGAKNDWENQQTLSAYRAGTFSGIIATSLSSPVKQPQKTQSEKICTPVPRVGARPKGELKVTQEGEKFTKMDKDRVKKTVEPFPHYSTLTSAISNQSVAHPVTQPAPQPLSVSRSVDKDFLRIYTQVTNEQLKSLAKCRSGLCENFGNKLKSGYCNLCFSILSENERHVAIFGLTETDSG